MNDWLGLIGTVLGVLLGGFLIHYREISQRNFSRASERRTLLINKYEELHKQLTLVRKSIGLLSIDLIGHVGLEDKIDFQRYSNKIPIEDVLMNTQFYAPSLNDEVYELNSIVERYFVAFGEVTVKHSSSPESERLKRVEKCMDISTEISAKVKEINTELSALASKIVYEK